MRWGAVALAVALAPFPLRVAGSQVADPRPPSAAVEPLDAQEEARLLREAAGFEWRGAPEEAVRTLESVLAREPSSAGALFALERVLRAVGRVEAVLPHADRFLALEPGAPGPHAMKLRVLAEIDSVAGLRPAAASWFAAERGTPDPYREAARIFRRSLDEAAALEILYEGRRVLGGDALALELGDLLASTGDEEAAVREWARALRDPAADVGGLVRRLERLEGDRATLVPPMIDALHEPPATLERREAAARVAMAWAPALTDEVVEKGLEGLGGGDLPRYLDAVARHATDAGHHGVAYGAFQRLREGTRGRPAAALDGRLGGAALAAGDTAAAREAFSRQAEALPRGSPERRQAVAALIRVEARTVDAGTLEERLAAFRSEFPGAPEADALAADAASALASRGHGEAALQVAEQVEGPRARLEQAWLLIEEGRIAEGREALEAALPALAPSPATEVVQLLARLDRVGPGAGAALALAAAHAHRGRSDEAVDELERALETVPPADRAPLHARTAELALSAGDSALAETHLRSIVDEHDGSAETPEALFVLARMRAADPTGLSEARALLERLILERPQAAVVPAARRELQRIGRGG